MSPTLRTQHVQGSILFAAVLCEISVRNQTQFFALCGFVTEADPTALTTCGTTNHLPVTTGAKSRMSIDDIKNGQRISCNGVYGIIIGKRSTRNQRFVLAKMDNGFTLKLKADTVSAELPEIGATAQLNSPTKQLASVD